MSRTRARRRSSDQPLYWQRPPPSPSIASHELPRRSWSGVATSSTQVKRRAEEIGAYTTAMTVWGHTAQWAWSSGSLSRGGGWGAGVAGTVSQKMCSKAGGMQGTACICAQQHAAGMQMVRRSRLSSLTPSSLAPV